MNDGLLAILLIGLIAGGGIIVVDYFVLRHVRNQAKDEPDERAAPDLPEKPD